MKNKNHKGFFDEKFRLERLASKEDPCTLSILTLF
jgi:hypothetical protein